MKLSNAIHFFSSTVSVNKKLDTQLLGIRGRKANEFSILKLPIVPGFIIDATQAQHIHKEHTLYPQFAPYFKKFAAEVNKEYGNAENPLLFKIVVSPNLEILRYPTLHNFGLTRDTLNGFAERVGANFAAHEVLFLLKGIFTFLRETALREDNEKKAARFDDVINSIVKDMKSHDTNLSGHAIMDTYERHLPSGFFDDAEIQFDSALQIVSQFLDLEEDNEEDIAILIQPMVYGNYDKESYAGNFFSRNIVTGNKKLQGEFFAQKFDDLNAQGKDINTLKPAYLKKLREIAWMLEDYSKEIRNIRFTVEAGKLWLIEQKSAEAKSTISLVHLLLDLYNRGIVDEEFVVRNVKPGQLNEILHPVIDMTSTKGLTGSNGGIAGAPGAAVGRVYFSADSLIEAKKAARLEGMDTRCILIMPATYAGDVKGIEAGTGVLSNEGGYAAHASVVARQYGKISLVRPDMKIQKKKAIIDGKTINEGDYITLSVPYYGESTVYFGKADLIEPDPKTSGLLDFIRLTKSFLQDFHVRANADSPRDAQLALDFGAQGIGLCRTEHMFFHEDRINIFRMMLLSEDDQARAKVLKTLQKMQRDDFYGIFKAMAGREVTIRLLDSPLHEFLPHNPGELKDFIDHLKKETGKAPNKAALEEQISMKNEINPMLGHRGCRVAISYPEIYAMQIKAIFEAAYKLKKENIDVHPEIMVPIVMNLRELKQIVYGKNIEGHRYEGIVSIEEEVREALKTKKIDYKIGTMIELPAAALSAGEIARYAEFFSFGTNDLTQTTLGLSRDDFNAFMPDYTMYDLINGNPFAVLDTRVKELITTAINRGKTARPDITTGLCGEHGARPENIRFCMDSGLHYVSCSSYSVPIALLAIVQVEFEKADKEGRKLTPKFEKEPKKRTRKTTPQAKTPDAPKKRGRKPGQKKKS